MTDIRRANRNHFGALDRALTERCHFAQLFPATSDTRAKSLIAKWSDANKW